MGSKILFVDDDPAWRDAVTIALQEAGYDVLIAKDASEAMQHGENGALGLIILDLNLAGESGLTLMKYLRHNCPGVPILIFTGLDHDDSTVQAMLEDGADQYLHKSGVAELVVIVGSYLKTN